MSTYFIRTLVCAITAVVSATCLAQWSLNSVTITSIGHEDLMAGAWDRIYYSVSTTTPANSNGSIEVWALDHSDDTPKQIDNFPVMGGTNVSKEDFPAGVGETVGHYAAYTINAYLLDGMTKVGDGQADKDHP